MKSTIRKKTYAAIYRLLDRVSPISGDCGKLCNCVCCTPDGDDFGIYLLPGEDKLFTKKEDWLSWHSDDAEYYDFPESWFGKVYFLRCNTPPICQRDLRPLQCRFYPLAPHLLDDGTLILILSTSAVPYNCPLISENIKLNQDFIKATYTVWKRLIQDPLIFDLVEWDSSDRDIINPVYPNL